MSSRNEFYKKIVAHGTKSAFAPTSGRRNNQLKKPRDALIGPEPELFGLNIPDNFSKKYDTTTVELVPWSEQNAFFTPITYHNNTQKITINKEGRYKITVSLCASLEGNLSTRPGMGITLVDNTMNPSIIFLRTILPVQSVRDLPPSTSNHTIINITEGDLPFELFSGIQVDIQQNGGNPAFLKAASLFIERSGSAQTPVTF
jgi:hypothetical protein